MKKYLILFILTYLVLFGYSFFFIDMPIKESALAILVLTIVATIFKYFFDKLFEKIEKFIKNKIFKKTL